MKMTLQALLFILTLSISAHAYQIIEPELAKEKMPCWAFSTSFEEYTEVIGYSALGHVFMRSPDTNEYIVLHPFKKAAKLYGEFKNAQDFEEKILQELSFKVFVLDSDRVSEIKERLGVLAKDEIYIPEPYPFLGGDESIDSYTKADVWVMLAIVGEFHGVCS